MTFLFSRTHKYILYTGSGRETNKFYEVTFSWKNFLLRGHYFLPRNNVLFYFHGRIVYTTLKKMCNTILRSKRTNGSTEKVGVKQIIVLSDHIM